MSELTDLVANLEQKYGSPLRDIPYNDPDFITIQKKYWPDNNQHKHPKHKKYREGTICKVIELKTGKEHIFQSFYQASKFYGYSQGWACKYYKVQKKGHNNPKYKIVKLE